MPKELPIEIINTTRDVASGMHQPEGETMWSVNNMAEDRLVGGLSDGKSPSDFDEDLLEEGRIIEMEHTSDKQVATEIAMDHLTEDLGYYKKIKKLEKEAIGLLDIPASLGGEASGESGEVLLFDGVPQNYGLSRELGDDEEVDFFGSKEEGYNLPQAKNVKNNKDSINLHRNSSCFDGDIMDNELKNLKSFFKEVGNMSGAYSVLKIQAQVSNDPELERQKVIVQDLQELLNSFGATTEDLVGLENGKLGVSDLHKVIGERSGKPLHSSKLYPISNAAGKYIIELKKLNDIFEKAEKSVEPKATVDKLEGQRLQPAAMPAKEGPIKRPGDPYTYDKNPNGAGYIIVSAPKGYERTIGRVIAPLDPGYSKIRAADPNRGGYLEEQPKKEQPKKVEEGAAIGPKDNLSKPKDNLSEPKSNLSKKELFKNELPESLENGSVGVSRGGILISSEKRKRLTRFYIENFEVEEGAMKYQTLISDLKSGKNISLKESDEQPSGRRVAIVDYGHELPGDLRYDGVYYDDSRQLWVSGGLKRNEVRSLELGPMSVKKRELGRERRQERKDERQERGEDRRRERIRRRERAKRKARASLIRGLHKVSKHS